MSTVEIICAVAVAVQAVGLTGIVLAINALREDIVTTRIITVPESIFADMESPPRFAKKTVRVPMTIVEPGAEG